MKKLLFAFFAALLLVQAPLAAFAAEYSPRHCCGGGYGQYRSNDDGYDRGGYCYDYRR